MSTYLVAYVVSDFHYKEAEPTPGDKNNVTFRIWSREDALGQVHSPQIFNIVLNA